MEKSFIKNPRYNDKILVLTCFIVGILIFIRDIGGVEFNKYILLMACIFTMPMLNYSNFLCFLGFLFALTFGIPSTYVYLFAAIILVFKKKFIFNGASLMMFMAFCIWEIVLSVIFQSTYGITTYIGYFSRLFLFFILINEQNEVDYKKILKFFVTGVLLFIVVVVLMYLKDNSMQDILRGRVRIGESRWYFSTDSISEGMKMSTNTNNVAYFCATAMACCLALLNREKKLIWGALFFVIFALGTLTVSKTFFMLAGLLLILYLNVTLFAHRLSLFRKMMLSTVIYAGVIVVFNTGTIHTLLNRFAAVDYLFQDSRTIIFKGYWDAFWGNPVAALVGTGAFMHREILYPNQSTHNALQQILVAYGLTGFTAFIGYCYWNIYRGYRKMKSAAVIDKITATAPLITVVLFTQTIQFLNPVDLMLPFIVGVLALRAYQD